MSAEPPSTPTQHSALSTQHSTIASAALVLMLGNVASRVLGLVRVQVMTALFGATGETDAFVAAYTVPTTVYDLLVGGAISAALVPVFVDVEMETLNPSMDAFAEADSDRKEKVIFLIIFLSLLPVAPDDSALLLKTRLGELLGAKLAVIITDTFGRPWREGLTNVAIGVAGMRPVQDFRGKMDDHGKELSATVLAVADEIAAASGLLMKKTSRTPVVVVRGYYYDHGEGNARELLRARERDLFR